MSEQRAPKEPYIDKGKKERVSYTYQEGGENLKWGYKWYTISEEGYTSNTNLQFPVDHHGKLAHEKKITEIMKVFIKMFSCLSPWSLYKRPTLHQQLKSGNAT